MVENKTFNISTEGYCDIVDITDKVFGIISKSEIKNGMVHVFTASSTSAITSIEYESGVVNDLQDYFERAVPQNMEYLHNKKWGDGNGFSHVRAALLKAGFTLPVIEGLPVMGTWQQIVFVDFDNKPRSRKILVQMIGE